MDTVMETTDNGATLQSAQHVQANAISTTVATTNTFPSALTFRPAQRAQENVISTTFSSPNAIAHTSASQSARQIEEDAMSASLAPFKNVPHASASQSAQPVQERAGHTPLPPFNTIPYAWASLSALDVGPSTTPAPPEAARPSSYSSRRRLLRQRRRNGRHPDPAIAQVHEHIEKWERFLKFLNRHIKRHREEDPSIPADYKQKEWNAATAEIEKLELELAPLQREWKFAHNFIPSEGLSSSDLKGLTSKLRKMRAQATRMAAQRQVLVRDLARPPRPHDQPNREYNLGCRIGRSMGEQNKLGSQIAEVEASIKELESRDVKMGENGDTKMSVEGMLNPVVEDGEDSNMGEAAILSTREEMEKLTARVAEL